MRDIILSDRNEQFKFIECHAGEISLRQEISAFLRMQRGVHCSPEQVVLCPGLANAFAVIAQIFPNDQKVLAMEEPGHEVARRVFVNEGFQIKTVPVTHSGIDVNELKKTKVNLSFVMPSHQFPLGGSLSVSKRFEILEWLEKTDSYLVEHDFDCFLRYHERPIPSIQGISDGNRVFHINTLEKLLFPNTNMCYLVIPPGFVETYNKKFADLHSTISGLEQQAVYRLLRDGQFEKYLRRLANESMKKHDILIEELSKAIGKKAIIGGHNAGTHITLRFCDGSKASDRIKEAEKVSVKVYSIKEHYFNENSFKDDTVLIGWNKISTDDLKKGIKLLCETWF
jgi:GntR family transcriptional regulator/MocR family aminotransferase